MRAINFYPYPGTGNQLRADRVAGESAISQPEQNWKKNKKWWNP